MRAPRLLVFHLLLALAWAAGSALKPVLLGPGDSHVRTDQLPVSVRDNPASWKPSYDDHTGYHLILVPVPSGGGGYDWGK